MKTLYGLPQEVFFCKKCVMSNQRPTSSIEFKHTLETKKIRLISMKMEFAMLVDLVKVSQKLIGF